MPLDPGLSISDRAAHLNGRYRNHAAISVMELALRDHDVGETALVSSFGAESVVLLHMASVLDAHLPILFIDTQMLFPETLAYQIDVAEKLGLTNIITIRADQAAVDFDDPDGTLHQFSTDACCALRKTVPLENALRPYDAWITGRKRFQSGTRAALEFFEPDGDTRLKVNPLAMWGREDIEDYIVNNRLPRHPLVSQGYPSIGCAPCTSPVKPGEDPRAGRWRGSEKEECGIHFINGKAVRIRKEDAA
ncbi:phosphoadenylyl-sulfate reductase [Falsirhodobacter deserti]|uniref:phosphoadenylyl-sulfate reductase n=1 Tax=Falsirhodobacter deserti TaxID=1365611 RepID=UPI000FE3C9D8|nr:phosphoadenylyl-sulfate reductase [Falsirhodobacter deserti]